MFEVCESVRWMGRRLWVVGHVCGVWVTVCVCVCVCVGVCVYVRVCAVILCRTVCV